MRFFKNLCVISIMLCTQFIVAQQSQEDKIKEVISLFFIGLQNGDTLTLKKTISNQLKLQTTFTNKEGKPVLRDDNVSKFLNAIASKKKGRHLGRKIAFIPYPD